MYNLKEIKKACMRFIKAYNSFDEFAYDWTESKPLVRKTINAINSMANEDDLPEIYWETQNSLYIDSQMFTDSKTIKKILKGFGPFITQEGKEVLSFWIDNPAFWCFYAIKETLEDDFFIIEDLVTEEKHLMYSRDITLMQKDNFSRNKHYLSLMLPNGSCLLTTGLPRFNLLSGTDVQFYFSLFSPGLDLGSAINRNFMKLMELDTICSYPIFVDGEIEIKKTWQPFKLTSFDITEIAGTWDSKVLGKQQKFDFVSGDSRMKNLPNGYMLTAGAFSLGATLVRDTKTGAMALTTRSDASYTLFAALLNRTYPQLELPNKPAISISMGLNSLLNDRDFPLLPWNKFSSLLEPQQLSDDTELFKPTIFDDWNQELLDRQYSNKPFDIRNLSLSEEPSGSTRISVSRVDEKDQPFELSGWPKPPREIEALFNKPLDDSPTFDVSEGDASTTLFNALTNGSYAKEIGKEGLAAFITALFVDYFPKDISLYLMNAFFWILYYKGKESIPARSYAIELLKLQPNLITDIYVERETFLQDFTSFIKKVLCTRGICSLSCRPTGEEVTKGTYTIKGTDAFYSLVVPAEYRVN